MPIRLIIFDLDGTLVDTITDIANAINFALQPYGARSLSKREVAAMVGEGAERLVRNAMEKCNLELDVNEILTSYTNSYSTHLTDNTVLYAGTVETLEELKNYRKALVSNKPEVLSRRLLREFGLEKYFDMVVCADSLPERKPSPLPIFYVTRTLGIRREDALIVGDSEIDILTGKASHIKTVAVTHGYGRPGFHKDADFVITALSQLKDTIEKIGK